VKGAELEARVSKHDREIEAIRQLIKTGMRLIVRIEHGQLENSHQIAELRASQQETNRQLQDTDRKIQNLLKAIERGRNGKPPS